MFPSPPVTVTRFAPSPTGPLHLGHALSAWSGWHAARGAGGRFLLRIEDIDAGRCRPEHEAAIFEDLAWLGLDWDGPVRRQSEHGADYRAALDRLAGLEVLYPCFCTRAEIRAEIERLGRAPHGPAVDGPPYPGTCRRLSPAEREHRIAAGDAHAWRLDATAALARTGRLGWHDRAAGGQSVQDAGFGDVVLARKDVATSYHLCVTVDDHLQGVTLVTRGLDLFHATPIHRVLQALLGYAVPDYHHHRLLTDAAGRRLAKRADAVAIRRLRAEGMSRRQVWALAGIDGPVGGS